MRLFYGVVYPHGIGTGHTRLHLNLGVVNPRLKIGVNPCQVKSTLLPVLKQMVRQKRSEHGPHSEVNVARLGQAAHTGIHHRITRVARFPGPVMRRIGVFGNSIKGPVHVLELNPVFALELLNKMTMPPQARRKGRKLACQTLLAPRQEVGFGSHLLLKNLPNAQTPPGKIRRQTAASPPTLQGLRDTFGV